MLPDVETQHLVEDADALEAGTAFVVLGRADLVTVRGRDAIAWLQDLLTAEIADLGVDHARRAFLLTPTGRIRTEVRVIRRDGRVELVGPAEAPRSIATLLAPYVLSSDVVLSDPVPVAVVAAPSPAGAALLATVGRGERPATPSQLGDGADLVATEARIDAIRASLGAHAREVDTGAAETLRIRRGIPRWGVDIEPDGFPIGARVDDAVAHAKGCFLGQEAVAKIRNLGHPPAVLRHLVTEARASRDEPLEAGGKIVGHVTSAAPTRDGTVVLARIGWRAATSALTLADGTPVDDVLSTSD